jgi:hypothetical protein
MQTWDTRLLRKTVSSVLAGVTVGLVGGAFRWCLAQAELHRDAMKALLERALTRLPEVSVLVLSDYDKGSAQRSRLPHPRRPPCSALTNADKRIGHSEHASPAKRRINRGFDSAFDVVVPPAARHATSLIAIFKSSRCSAEGSKTAACKSALPPTTASSPVSC